MSEHYWTPDQLAQRWNVSRSSILDRARRGEIPHSRFGPRTVRFTDEQVAEIEQQARRETKAKQQATPMYGLSPRSRHRRRLAET